MIKKFKVGKWYRWTGGKDVPEEFADSMVVLLDGKPHKVTRKSSYDCCASFEDCEYSVGGNDGWWFNRTSMTQFEEVQTEEVNG